MLWSPLQSPQLSQLSLQLRVFQQAVPPAPVLELQPRDSPLSEEQPGAPLPGAARQGSAPSPSSPLWRLGGKLSWGRKEPAGLGVTPHRLERYVAWNLNTGCAVQRKGWGRERPSGTVNPWCAGPEHSSVSQQWELVPAPNRNTADTSSTAGCAINSPRHHQSPPTLCQQGVPPPLLLQRFSAASESCRANTIPSRGSCPASSSPGLA